MHKSEESKSPSRAMSELPFRVRPTERLIIVLRVFFQPRSSQALFFLGEPAALLYASWEYDEEQTRDSSCYSPLDDK